MCLTGFLVEYTTGGGMATRIGAFKAKTSQLVIWQNQHGISFAFGKHYKDKQTGEWKESKSIYADELKDIGEMFLRAAQWAAKKNCTEPLPQGVARINNVIEGITAQLKDKHGTSKDS